MAVGSAIIVGDALDGLSALRDGLVDCVVTSPPYFAKRDYEADGQIGLEPTVREYVSRLVSVMRECRRVLRDDGSAWVNVGDTLASKPNPFDGTKRKDLLLIPARLAIALQEDGWYVRSEIVWVKPDAMPESVTDRPTSAHERVLMLTKSPRYYYDAAAVAEPCKVGWRRSAFHKGKTGRHQGGRASALERTERDVRNLRNVWEFATARSSTEHLAVMPVGLAARCIAAGCPDGGTVLDPFGGSGTTAAAANALGRNAILCEINPTYAELARARLAESGMDCWVETAASLRSATAQAA